MDLMITCPEMPTFETGPPGRSRDDPSSSSGSIQPLYESLEGDEAILGHQSFYQAVGLGSSKAEGLQGLSDGIEPGPVDLHLPIHLLSGSVIPLEVRAQPVDIRDTGVTLPNLEPEPLKALPRNEGSRRSVDRRGIIRFR